MLIVCPQCTASYRVAPSSLGSDGRSVRCANCHTIWFATPQAEPEQALATAPVGSWPDMPDRPSPDFAANESDRLTAPAETEATRPGADTGAPADAETPPADAEPLAMPDAPSIVPPPHGGRESPRAAHALPGEDIESLAARRERDRQRRRFWRKMSVPGLPTLLVALGGIVLVLIVARNQVVRYMPQTASFYAAIGLPVNLRGLDFEDIRVTREIQDGIPVLVVEGRIVNAARGIAEVSRVRLAIHDKSGKEIYAWTMMPSRSLLAPGESLPFRSRLASPPAEGQNVSIRFFNRQDAISGFR
jgi:predicted Zn finger-like uncharacterized protein